MAPAVHLRIKREISHPLDTAYAWLTDYEDGDAARAGAIIKARRIDSREGNRIFVSQQMDVLGRRGEGTGEIILAPPDAWTAHVFDQKGRQRGTYRYKLVPQGPGQCTLEVDYGFVAARTKHWLRMMAAKGRIRREIHRMWDGFISSMDEELGIKAIQTTR